MRVLGIDPGIRTTGFGIIDSNSLLLVKAYNSNEGGSLIKLDWVYYRFSQIYLFLNNLHEANYYAKKSLDLNPNFEKAREIINTTYWKKFIL